MHEKYLYLVKLMGYKPGQGQLRKEERHCV